MSGKIAPTPTATSPAAPAAKSAAPPRRDEGVHRAASEFEAMLVRQLLSTMKLGGKESGYADMAVDALATSMTSGKGLGLAREIEDCLAHSIGPARKKT